MMRHKTLIAFVILASSTVSGCLTTGFPETYSKYPVQPVAKTIQDRKPIVAITFPTGLTDAAKSRFISTYRQYPIEFLAEDESLNSEEPTNGATEQMIAKSVYYAVRLHKYLADRNGGAVDYVLNPVKIGYSDGKFTYERRNGGLPNDVEVDLLAYVHPKSRVSTFSMVTSTFGFNFAPIVSITTAPQYNPDSSGAIALTSELASYGATGSGGRVRAGLIEYLNARIADKSSTPLYKKISERASDERPLKAGHYMNLPMQEIELIEVAKLKAEARYRYAGRGFVEDEVFNVYFNIVSDALNALDFSAPDPAVKTAYYALYDPAASVQLASLGGTRHPKIHYLDQFQKAEIAFQVKRDSAFAQDVLFNKKWVANMDKLRLAERKAHDEFKAAQVRAAVSFLAAVGGAALAASSNNQYVQAAGITTAIIGVGVGISAAMELNAIEQAFESSYDPVYAEASAYTITAIDGEKFVIRPKNLADLRHKMKQIYDRKFGAAAHKDA